MNKVIVVIVAVFVLGISAGWAQITPNSSQIQAAPVEVGNKICPVSGNPIGAMGPAIKHEYNGKIYNLCCPMCPHTFDSDPAKYAKIAEDEVKATQK